MNCGELLVGKRGPLDDRRLFVDIHFKKGGPHASLDLDVPRMSAGPRQ
jgi:hypothetical protein